MLRVTFNMGFFCCCVVRLNSIVDFYNTHGYLPLTVDSSQQFLLYKQDPNLDITPCFFQTNRRLMIQQDLPSKLKFFHRPDDLEFPVYTNLNFDHLNPIVQRYFYLAEPIKDRVGDLERKYNLDFSVTCLIYYRGNDKEAETYIPSYQEMVEKGLQLLNHDRRIRFVVQTDEIQFWTYFSTIVPDAIMLTETKPISRQNINPGLAIPVNDRQEFCSTFLSVIYYLSRCRYIITTTGHVAMWLCLFRGNSDGIQQYLNPKPSHLRYVPAISERVSTGDNFWY